MTPRHYDRRPRWRDAVLASNLQPMTKLVLLVTLDHMQANGKVCVGRATIASALGIQHPQRVSERWTQACDANFLTLVHKGSHGRHSTYEALLPDVSSVRATRTLETPRNPDTRDSSKCPRLQDAITTDPAQTQPHAAPGAHGTDRNAGSKESGRSDRAHVRAAVDHLGSDDARGEWSA